MKTILITLLALTIGTIAKAQKAAEIKGLEADTLIFTTVEHEPEFKGGDTALYSYLQQAMVYPADARKKNIQGKVFLMFVVEKDGSITNVKVVRGIGGGCDEEAARVMKASPKWKPGIQNNRPLRVRYIMPISFTLQ